MFYGSMAKCLGIDDVCIYVCIYVCMCKCVLLCTYYLSAEITLLFITVSILECQAFTIHTKYVSIFIALHSIF